MWNTPLINGTGLSIATGCGLVLHGLSFGLFVAGVCLAFATVSVNWQTGSSLENSSYISDDEIEIIIELVRDAITGSGWTLCGNCYTRNLLQQLPLPVQKGEQSTPFSPTSLRLQEPSSTRRVDDGEHPAQNTPDSHKNGHERSSRVELGEHMGRVATLSH